MAYPPTPNTARPIYATAAPHIYYDNSPTPRAADYNQQFIQPRNQLPQHSPSVDRIWNSLPSTNRKPHSLLQETQPDVYEAAVPLRHLNAYADEFRPSGLAMRPASSLSVSSSRSSSASVTSSSMSLATPATSVWGARMSKSPASNAVPSPHPHASPIPLFPNIDPGEQTYRVYRERLRNATDLSMPISCILEAGVGHYEHTQHIAILADRLSAHAPCGRDEFKVRLRAEAIEMFIGYWQGVRSSFSLIQSPTSSRN